MRPLVPIALLGAFVAIPLLNVSVLQSLLTNWSRDGDPGYVVVAISLYFAWRLLQRVAEKPAQPSRLALLFLFAAGFLSFAGHAAQVQVVQQFALWLQIGLWIAVVLGWRALRLMLPALLILLFALPLFDFLTDPLRQMAVAVTRQLLHWFGIPAFIDGYHITVPAGRFFVAGGCSGLNFLIAGTMIGYLHAYLHFSHRWRQLVVIALAAALAVVSNWVRIVALVLIGYHTEMRSELVYQHGTFGWWVFAGAMGLFFLFAHLLAANDPRHGKAAIAGIPHAQRWQVVIGWSAVALLVVALFPLWARLIVELDSAQPTAKPQLSASWRVEQPPDWQPQFQFHDRADHWRTDDGDRHFSLSVLTYLQQRQGKEMIYWNNAIAAEEHRLGQEVIERDGLRLNRSLIRDRGQSRLVWWLYRVGSHTAVRDDIGKLLQLAALLQGDPTTALVALSLPCDSSLCQQELASEEFDVTAARLLREYLQAPSN